MIMMSDLTIECEISTYDDTQTSHLIRKFILSVRDMDGQCGRVCTKPLMCTKEYGFGYIWF